MAKNLSTIRAICRQFLKDEFSESTDEDFASDEIDLYIGRCLTEISQTCPYMDVDKTLTTSEDSKEVDISSIREGLLWIDKVEFRVDSDPRDFRNFTLWGDTLEIDTDLTPEADEEVYIYCAKEHTLTESASTLSPQLEKILIDGVVAYVALAWLNNRRTLSNKVNVGKPEGFINSYQVWANEKLILYRADLGKITKPRTHREYPKD